MSTQELVAEEETLPSWLQGYEDPVIRTPGKGKAMHKPDFSAGEPRPACNTQGNDANYAVTERARLEGFYEPCGNPQCFGGER